MDDLKEELHESGEYGLQKSSESIHPWQEMRQARQGFWTRGRMRNPPPVSWLELILRSIRPPDTLLP